MLKRTAICMVAAVGLLSLTSGCGLLCALLGLGTTCGGTGDPAEFTAADAARGGALYDNWWDVTGQAAPTGDHPLYPASGTQSGSGTHRCKECHGWDYKGKDGAYATGSHATGIIGIFGTTKTPQEVFDLIKNAPSTSAQATLGHNFGTVLLDTDIWDLAKFVLTEGQFNTSDIIDAAGLFTGSAATGATLYGSGIAGGLACTLCHGADGKTLEFAPGEFLGTLANDNPWELQHKIRFGQPGEAMPSAVSNGGTTQDVNDVGTHAQTLPTS